MSPSDATRRLVRERVVDVPWTAVGGHGSSGVWRCGSIFVKEHGSARKWRQEVEAYRVVVTRLEALGWRLPQLLAVDSESRSLLITAVEGVPVEAEAEWAHREAGRFCAALHALDGVPEDTLSIGEALCARLEAALGHVELPREMRARCRDAVRAEYFAGAERRWCHRDFAPRNWLAADGELVVIDFEHMRPDHPLVDVVKLWCGTWRGRPAFLRAWEQGRGRPLSEDERSRVEALSWVHAVGTLAWGARNDDAASVREGWHSVRTLYDGGVGG
jgi:hypothetical protein